jgi:hypothetical protein
MLKLQNQNFQTSKSAILPSYYYPNKPVTLGRSAYDTIDIVKNNKMFENNKNIGQENLQKGIDNNHALLDLHTRSQYLGGTTLIHNPIINPVDDVNRNIYLGGHKYRHMFHNPDNLLKSAGYSIIN